jgi:hypothetical protein
MEQKESATNAASGQEAGGKLARRRTTFKKGSAGVPPEDRGTPAAAPDRLDVKEKEQDSALLSRIRERAYGLFKSCGCQHGHDLEHWLEAERQVANAFSKSGSDRDVS